MHQVHHDGPELSVVRRQNNLAIKIARCQARTKGADKVGDVVVEEDAGEDVFRGVDGHRDFEEACVALEGVVDGDVFEARIEDGGVKQDEAEVAAGLCGDLVGIDGGAARHEVDGGDDVVDAQAEEGFADEFSTKLR